MVGQECCYPGGEIFIIFIKVKEALLREQCSLQLETTVHYMQEDTSSHLWVPDMLAFCSSNGGLILKRIRSQLPQTTRQPTKQPKNLESIPSTRKRPLENKGCQGFTPHAPLWWSLPQPQGDICASGVHGPDAPDGPCKLHRIWISDSQFPPSAFI